MQDDKTFDGVDENMELDEADQSELMKFETIQTKDIEFDKIKLADVHISYLVDFYYSWVSRMSIGEFQYPDIDIHL